MHYAILTDLNKCVGCMACSVGCKAANGVAVGKYWNKILRVGPTPKAGGSGQFPDVEMYFMPMQCQHCYNPSCVEVCPAGASYVAEDGTVQIDSAACIGCGLCLSACPYNVRFMTSENTASKCNMCAGLADPATGRMPQCVQECGGLARFWGDADGDIMDFVGPYDRTLREYLEDGAVEPWEDSDVHKLEDSGNGPAMIYILRKTTWTGAYPKLGD